MQQNCVYMKSCDCNGQFSATVNNQSTTVDGTKVAVANAHDVQRVRIDLDRLATVRAQLLECPASANLRLLRPCLVDQCVKCPDDISAAAERYAAGFEQNDLLYALSKISLHRRFDLLVGGFAGMLCVEQKTIQ